MMNKKMKKVVGTMGAMVVAGVVDAAVCKANGWTLDKETRTWTKESSNAIAEEYDLQTKRSIANIVVCAAALVAGYIIEKKG
jgi:hypothetical protein